MTKKLSFEGFFLFSRLLACLRKYSVFACETRLSNREEYFSTAQKIVQFIENCTRRVFSQLFFREKWVNRW